jgi:hypothetical protein
LQIPLKPFQRVALHIAATSNDFMFVCSRGLSKSWMCGVLAIAVANLWPRSEIIITSSTVAQGNKMAEKILNEIIKRNSPVLLYMYEKEYWIKQQRDDGWIFENKLNGSTIRVLPALDSSRGSRATMLIYEEARLIKFNIIQSVFRPMSHPRQAQFLTNPKYGRNERWLEDTKTVYLSSASYTFEWLYREWKRHVVEMYNNPRSKTNVFAGDIYTSIQNGLKTIGDYKKAKRAASEESFNMEDLNQFIGESEDAFFGFESFKSNQIIQEAFTPPTPMNLILGDVLNNPKREEDEVRMVVADFAWTPNGKKSRESDNSVAVCIRAKWKKDHFDKYVDYIEMLPTADNSDGCADRLKELFWLYEADYLVADCRSGGEAIMIALSKPYTNERYAGYINNHGLTMSDKKEYHVARPDKLDYYRANAVDPNAYPCIIPIVGSENLNTAYWKATRVSLEGGRIKFLQSMSDKQDAMVDSGEYYKYTSDKLADILAPHGNTDMLISEAVNLKTIIKNDQIKLEPPINGHRDRIVTLAMGILICDYIENEWNRQNHAGGYDYDDMQFVW